MDESGRAPFETFAAALILAAAFLGGARIRPLRAFTADSRTLVSFGAGMAMAYVFVHVMPELHGARSAFVESAAESKILRFEGMAVYLVALIGFLTFYGVDHLRKRMRSSATEDREQTAYRLHVGGFAAYVALASYLLVHSLESSPISIGLYTLAMAFHFLAVDHSLREEHGAVYDGGGRFWLAAMVLIGWGIGELIALPRAVVALLLAYLSGAVILNSSVMELPSEKDGRFVPFLCGGLLYGLVLLPLG